MNNKRMRFGFLVLAIYAALGVVGIASRAPDASGGVQFAAIAKSATNAATSASGGGGAADASAEWHSFLPGAFK
jgi:hypothetical protein